MANNCKPIYKYENWIIIHPDMNKMYCNSLANKFMFASFRDHSLDDDINACAGSDWGFVWLTNAGEWQVSGEFDNLEDVAATVALMGLDKNNWLPFVFDRD